MIQLNLKKQQGFLLIEGVLLIILLAILSKIAAILLAEGFSAYLHSKVLINKQWQAQMALTRMLRDFPQLRSANDIIEKFPDHFIFVTGNNERLAYFQHNDQVLLNNEVLADGIQQLIFHYYNKNGNPANLTEPVAYVTITMTSHGKSILSTAIFLRNVNA